MIKKIINNFGNKYFSLKSIIKFLDNHKEISVINSNYPLNLLFLNINDKKKKIIIFTRHSRKIGLGHFIRSQRLYFELKKFKCEFYVNKNKNFIILKLKKQNYFTIIIFDFKKYDKFFLKYSKNLFYILFDQHKIKKNNLISLNPLNLKKNDNLNGPKCFAFPNSFFRKNKKKTFKKKFNIFISQGGTDSNKNLKK